MILKEAHNRRNIHNIVHAVFDHPTPDIILDGGKD